MKANTSTSICTLNSLRLFFSSCCRGKAPTEEESAVKPRVNLLLFTDPKTVKARMADVSHNVTKLSRNDPKTLNGGSLPIARGVYSLSPNDNIKVL